MESVSARHMSLHRLSARYELGRLTWLWKRAWPKADMAVLGRNHFSGLVSGRHHSCKQAVDRSLAVLALVDFFDEGFTLMADIPNGGADFPEVKPVGIRGFDNFLPLLRR